MYGEIINVIITRRPKHDDAFTRFFFAFRLENTSNDLIVTHFGFDSFFHGRLTNSFIIRTWKEFIAIL